MVIYLIYKQNIMSLYSIRYDEFLQLIKKNFENKLNSLNHSIYIDDMNILRLENDVFKIYGKMYLSKNPDTESITTPVLYNMPILQEQLKEAKFHLKNQQQYHDALEKSKIQTEIKIQNLANYQIIRIACQNESAQRDEL